MVVDKVDMSLDDIIATGKKGRGRGRGGRGFARGNRRGGAGRSSGGFRRDGNRGGSGPVRRGRGTNRSAPYNRAKDIPDKWEHDMYDGVGRNTSNRREGLTTGSHLQISNLDFGVTEADIKELFSEFGKLKKAIINYDSSGRSHGTADVVYERKADAVKAFNTYNGVPLDGRPMKIEQVTPQVTSSAIVGSRRESRGSGSVRGFRGGNQNRSSRGSSSYTRGSRGSGRSRGGRGGRGGRRSAPPSKDQLDKELDSYIESAN